MRTVLATTDSDIALFAEQPDLAGLLTALRRARGFALYFARCNSPVYRRRLVATLKDRLSRPIVEVDLKKGGRASLDAKVEVALDKAPPEAVAFLYNLESFLPSDNQERQTQTLNELNWRRGAFSRLQHPLVFWLPEYALTILARGAPDFYDWYSGVYEFNEPDRESEEAIRPERTNLENLEAVRGLSLEEKRRWAEVLDELIAQTNDETEAGKQTMASLLKQSATVAYVQADYTRAKSALERALKINEAAYGPDHPTVAIDVNNLGLVLQALGDLPAAKQAFERALKIDEAAYGPDHPTVAIDVNNLGSVLQDLGDLPAAKQAFERAIAIGEAAYGPNHPKVATFINNLGLVLRALGDLPAAKQAYERALKIDEATYGPDHPTVAIDVNNLGSVLQALGDLPAAKQAFEQALKIDEATYGPDHPTVAIDVNNLGNVQRALGDLSAAKAYYERALMIFRQYLGDEHPNTKVVKNNLIGLLQ